MDNKLQVRLSNAQAAQVRDLCASLGIPVMTYLRQLIRDDMRERGTDYAADPVRGGKREKHARSA